MRISEDFNFTGWISDRLETDRVTKSMQDFNAPILALNLVDIPLNNGMFAGLASGTAPWLLG